MLTRVDRWSVEVLDETTSTNAVLAERARAGAPEGLVVAAEHQSAGRGRLDRQWQSPARSGLTFSMLLRPAVPDRSWPWLPLLAGIAVLDGIARASGAQCRLKWPNDVLLGDRKLGGLLAERVETPTGPAAVLGVGVNVSTRTDELPVPAATSLAVAGWPVDRTVLLSQVLAELTRRYSDWTPAATSELRAAYRARCASVGQPVRVHLPGREPLEGTASDIDPDGALVVVTTDGPVAVSAGDVVHLRAAPVAGCQG